MPSQPISRTRWLVAAALLALIVIILLFKAPGRSDSAPSEAEPVTPPPTQQETAAVESDEAEIEEEPLPVLDSLSAWDPDQPPERRKLDLQHWETEQGARVYFMQAEELPMLDVQILYKAGASRDGELSGVASMTNAMLNEGTGQKDAGDIAAGFERLGAEFNNSSHRDMALAGLRSLTDGDKLNPALSLFAEVIARPSFPEEAFDRLRNQALAGLKFRLQRPSALASEAFWAELYPDHPYGTLPQGQAESLNQITPADLRAFHQQFYSAGNAVIAMVGAVDRQQAEQIAQRLADAMPQGPAAEPIAAPEPIEPAHRHIPFRTQQTHILVGQHGISRHNPDYAALYVGNHILGGSGFGSRLMKEIRESRGLSYSVSSSFTPMEATGPFMVSMQTRADQVDLALEVINNSLDRFIAEGPTDAELTRTKRQILGEFPLSTASNSAIVGQLGAIGFYSLPLNHLQLFMDQVQALSAEDIRAAFQRHLAPEARLVITAGPAPEAPEAEADVMEPAVLEVPLPEVVEEQTE